MGMAKAFWQHRLGKTIIFLALMATAMVGGLSFSQRNLQMYNCGLTGRAIPPMAGDREKLYRVVSADDMWSETEKLALDRIKQQPDPEAAMCSIRLERRLPVKLGTVSEVYRNAEHALFARRIMLLADERHVTVKAATYAADTFLIYAYDKSKRLKALIFGDEASAPSQHDLEAALNGRDLTLLGAPGWGLTQR